MLNRYGCLVRCDLPWCRESYVVVVESVVPGSVVVMLSCSQTVPLLPGDYLPFHAFFHLFTSYFGFSVFCDCQSASLSLCLSVCLFFCFCLHLCLSVSLSFLSLSLSFSLSLSLFLSFSLCLSLSHTHTHTHTHTLPPSLLPSVTLSLFLFVFRLSHFYCLKTCVCAHTLTQAHPTCSQMTDGSVPFAGCRVHTSVRQLHHPHHLGRHTVQALRQRVSLLSHNNNSNKSNLYSAI